MPDRNVSARLSCSVYLLLHQTQPLGLEYRYYAIYTSICSLKLFPRLKSEAKASLTIYTIFHTKLDKPQSFKNVFFEGTRFLAPSVARQRSLAFNFVQQRLAVPVIIHHAPIIVVSLE